jgi:hypothetical protein
MTDIASQNQANTMHAKPNRDTVPQIIDGRINGRFARGYSGNPGGSPEATRRAFNKRFLLDLAEDWQQHGREVFRRVRRESPASYLKVCAMMVPRELKVAQTQAVKAMSDEQIEAAIEVIQGMLEARAGDQVSVIEATAEPVPALPAPTRKARHKANGTMGEGMCGGDGESNS